MLTANFCTSKFVDSHLQPYKCKIPTCMHLGFRFSSTASLLRHEREAHAMYGHGDKPFLCTYDGCERGVPGNGFPRHWNLRDHLRRVHQDSGDSGRFESKPPLRKDQHFARGTKEAKGRIARRDTTERSATRSLAARDDKMEVLGNEMVGGQPAASVEQRRGMGKPHEVPSQGSRYLDDLKAERKQRVEQDRNKLEEENQKRLTRLAKEKNSLEHQTEQQMHLQEAQRFFFQQARPSNIPSQPERSEVPFTDSGYASLPKLNRPTSIVSTLDELRCLANTEISTAVNDMDREDANTVYSAGTTVGPARAQHYIAQLCNDIYNKLGQCFDDTLWDTLSEALPGLIKAFAIRIGYDSSAPVNQEIMCFIHKRHG